MKWTLNRRSVLLAFCLPVLVLFGCAEKATRIGAVLPLTGEYQSYGEPSRRGIELALEHLKADPKFTDLELSIVDSESDPEKARDLLAAEYDAGATVALGGVTSDEALTMVGVVDRYDRILLSPSATSPELTGISSNFYRICASDFTAGSKMANFAVGTLNIEKVVVVAEERSYAKGIQEVFQAEYERQGGEVLEVISVPPNTGDFSGLIDRVMTLTPDAVYLAGYETGIAAAIQELRRQKYAGRILTTQAFATPVSIARVGQGAVGVVLTQTVFELDSEHAHVQKFVNGYKEKYGEDPDIFSAQGYDAMRVLAEAIVGRPPMTSELKKGMRDIQDFPGVTGSILFDDKGDVRKYPRVYVIGDDLGLYDYSRRLDEQRQKIIKQREALRERLEKLREEAAEMSDG